MSVVVKTVGSNNNTFVERRSAIASEDLQL